MAAASSLPRITVLVPTRDRAVVLGSALRTICAQDYDRLRIVVSDNASEDATREVVRSLDDPRIAYFNTGSRLALSGNCEFALDKVDEDEGFVTLVGDDDGLLPGALDRLAALLREMPRCRAVASRLCHYVWPGSGGFAGAPRLSVPLGRGREIRRTARWLPRVLRGEARYFDLPMLYNGGFIDAALLRALRARGGRFYRSGAHDVYSAIAIAGSIDEYAYSEVPFSISGASSFSTGASHFSRDGGAAAGSAYRRFLSENPIPPHPAVPPDARGGFPPSMQALVYESYLQSSYLRERNGLSSSSSFSFVTPAQQLEIILAQADPSDPRVPDWAVRFAEVHRIDLADVFPRARRRRVALRLRTLPRDATEAFDTRVVTAAEFPLDDVYQASLCAGEILRAPPGPVGKAGRFVRRLVAKVAGR